MLKMSNDFQEYFLQVLFAPRDCEKTQATANKRINFKMLLNLFQATLSRENFKQTVR
jgi:hypothetical protein